MFNKKTTKKKVKAEAGVCENPTEVSSIWTGPENAVDGQIVPQGETIYRFKTTMEQAYDVQIGATAEESLDNLKRAKAQNGESGKHYFEGTRGNSLNTLEITL